MYRNRASSSRLFSVTPSAVRYITSSSISLYAMSLQRDVYSCKQNPKLSTIIVLGIIYLRDLGIMLVWSGVIAEEVYVWLCLGLLFVVSDYNFSLLMPQLS